MKKFITAAATIVALASPAVADGDAAKGESDFKKCKSCHALTDADGNDVVKGGKTGPNLWGVVGRQAGSYEGFKFGDSLIQAGAAGLVWDVAQLIEYVQDPKAFLIAHTGDAAAKTKMTFKLKDAENVVAYLATLGPVADEDEGEGEAEGGEASND